ncbi:MAG: helix-turn-helix domain-containing protein [Bifidobacteriaceae bacterium]|jgi:transcriptional regulator with XRE-family HTH domain|nr:helix-turn-helix domain-containing protein [Bifidobacteriaceae bacterium]
MIIEQLKEARLSSRTTSQRLAKLSSTQKSAISMYENGKISPTVDTLARIGSVLEKEMFFLTPVNKYISYNKEKVRKVEKKVKPNQKLVTLDAEYRLRPDIIAFFLTFYNFNIPFIELESFINAKKVPKNCTPAEYLILQNIYNHYKKSICDSKEKKRQTFAFGDIIIVEDESVKDPLERIFNYLLNLLYFNIPVVDALCSANAALIREGYPVFLAEKSQIHEIEKCSEKVKLLYTDNNLFDILTNKGNFLHQYYEINRATERKVKGE